MFARDLIVACTAGLALSGFAACGESDSDPSSGGTGGTAGAGGAAGASGTAGTGGTGGTGDTGGTGGTGDTGGTGGTGDTGGTGGNGGAAASSGAAGSNGGALTVAEWVVEQEHFAFVHGTYGKGTYCGAFEKGAIPGYEDVRCTDTGSYIFGVNQDGTLRMEETIYLHRISTPDPDGTFPWFVDNGYSGSMFWKLTPTTPALDAVDDTEAMEFDMIAEGGTGNDPYWEAFGASGLQVRIILARGQADDALLEWTTADYDDGTSTWVDRPDGDLFPGWFIEHYPDGAFSSVVCPAADRIAGATISDCEGGTLATGPGYCAPKCRMATDEDPNGANGLDACAGSDLAERPRATALLPTP
jgi:hypothetical protein